MPHPTSIIIVADHRLFGECLAAALAKCELFTILAVVQTAEAVLQQLQRHPAEIVLIDEELPYAMALLLTKQITHDFPTTQVLLLGITETPGNIQQYVEAGASGYVLKDAPFHELQAVLEGVSRGETVCSPYIAYAMFTRLSELATSTAPNGASATGILSDREVEILQWMAEGWSNRQIAEYLCLSPHTVKNHVHNILKKLRLQRRLEAIKYAVERQWLALDGRSGRTGHLPARVTAAMPMGDIPPTHGK